FASEPLIGSAAVVPAAVPATSIAAARIPTARAQRMVKSYPTPSPLPRSSADPQTEGSGRCPGRDEDRGVVRKLRRRGHAGTERGHGGPQAPRLLDHRGCSSSV